MYRLNGLLIADQIRTAVAVEMRLGRPVLPPSADDDSPVWPALNFGWTLADVVNNTASRQHLTDAKAAAGLAKAEDRGGGVGSVPAARDGHEADEESGGEEEEWNSWEEGREGEDMGRMAHRLMSKLAAEERLNKKKKLGRTASFLFLPYCGFESELLSQNRSRKQGTKTKVSKFWNISSNLLILKELFFSGLHPHYDFLPPRISDAFKGTVSREE